MTLIDNFVTDIINITRFEAGSLVKGKYVAGATNNFDIEAAVIPISGKELVLLPEGERTKEMIVIYSDVELLTVNEKDFKKADRLSWRGKDYEIHKVEDWTKTDLPHYRIIAMKLEENEGIRPFK